MNRIEELLNTPYWIIDILPYQVPKDSPGQYFAIEDYFLKEPVLKLKGLDALKEIADGRATKIYMPSDISTQIGRASCRERV